MKAEGWGKKNLTNLCDTTPLTASERKQDIHFWEVQISLHFSSCLHISCLGETGKYTLCKAISFILSYTHKNQTLTFFRTEWHICVCVPGAVAYITAVSAGTERCVRKTGSLSGSKAESTSTPSSRASPRQACKRQKERERRQQCEMDSQRV